MNYDVDYFIRKYEGTADESWCINIQHDGAGRYCAYGHLTKPMWRGNHGPNEETDAIARIFDGFFGGPYGCNVTEINNGHDNRYPQPTPKARILAALRDIKAKQQPEKVKIMVVDDKPLPARIVYVTVDKEVRELQQKELCES